MSRILVVGSAPESGGGVSSVIRLHQQLTFWQKYHCYWLGTQIQAGKLRKTWYAIKANIISLLILWKYDIVHFHTTPDVSGLTIQLPIFLFAKLIRKKTIIHLHVGDQLAWNTNNKLFLYWLRKCNRIVVLSEGLKKQFYNYYPSIETTVNFINNPCEKVKPLEYSNHEKYILYAGRFTSNKGGTLLLKAFSIIHQQFPDWKVLCLGDGQERQIYEQICKVNGIEAKVNMPGFKHGKELSDAYRKAGIFCLTSHYEGFPMVVLEAWSYGVPVLSTPVGGLKDLITKDKNGCLFEKDNVEDLAEKLKHLISDYALRESISRNSLDFVQSHFSKDIVNEQCDRLYSELLN